MSRQMRFFLTLLVFPLSVLAENLSVSFPAGSGSAYKIKMNQDSTPVYLSLYIASTRVDSVHVEYFMETKGLSSIQMWQQFEIGITDKGSEVRSGYVQTNELPKPEQMPKEYLQGALGGIEMNNYLFLKNAEIDKYKIGTEIVEIAAGTTQAVHYRMQKNGQTLDYWISDDAKPIGLVMLVSKNEKNPNQNYSLELTHLINNIKPKIIPEKAVTISDKGRSLLVKPK